MLSRSRKRYLTVKIHKIVQRKKSETILLHLCVVISCNEFVTQGALKCLTWAKVKLKFHDLVNLKERISIRRDRYESILVAVERLLDRPCVAFSPTLSSCS